MNKNDLKHISKNVRKLGKKIHKERQKIDNYIFEKRIYENIKTEYENKKYHMEKYSRLGQNGFLLISFNESTYIKGNCNYLKILNSKNIKKLLNTNLKVKIKILEQEYENIYEIYLCWK